MTALEYLKKQTRNDALALIVSDDWAKRVLVSWTYHPTDFRDFLLSDGISPLDAKKAAWRGVKPDERLLCKLAGVPQRLARDKFEMLKTVGLIYPDGTAYDLALRVIGNEVATVVKRSLPTEP